MVWGLDGDARACSRDYPASLSLVAILLQLRFCPSPPCSTSPRLNLNRFNDLAHGHWYAEVLLAGVICLEGSVAHLAADLCVCTKTVSSPPRVVGLV